MVAGHETTVNLIGNAVYLLGRWPDQKQRLLDDPGPDLQWRTGLLMHGLVTLPITV